MTDLNSWLRAVVHWVAPARCAACDELLADVGDPVAGFCGGCGLLFESAPDSLSPPAEDAALFVYGGPLAEALRRFKYQGRTELAGVLGRLMLLGAEPYVGLVDAVVPVPLHRARFRQRGFNQSALLGAVVAAGLGVARQGASLHRVRPTAQQAQLPWSGRMRNVRGAFRVRGCPRFRRLLLVDDVRTSGATMAEAASTLRIASGARVYCLALAAAEIA